MTDWQPRIDGDIDPPFSLIEQAALAIMRTDYPEEFCADGTLTEAGQMYWGRRGHWYVEAAGAAFAVFAAANSRNSPVPTGQSAKKA